MAGVRIDPLRLAGPWDDGYVLERQHTLSSEFIGHDSFGHPRFDTKRSELGDLIFRLKNRNDKATIDRIVDAAVQFVVTWNPQCDLIVPIPPSRQRVAYQPVSEIARGLGTGLGLEVADSAVRKVKDTPELKNVFDYEQRMQLLQDAFAVEDDGIKGRRVLLVDDLYRSGATAVAVTQSLRAAGAATVFLLAMTKTRTRT